MAEGNFDAIREQGFTVQSHTIDMTAVYDSLIHQERWIWLDAHQRPMPAAMSLAQYVLQDKQSQHITNRDSYAR